MGNAIAILLTVICVGALFWASIRLTLQPIAQLMMLAGAYVLSGTIMLIRELRIEGFSWKLVFPKSITERIISAFLSLVLIVLVSMVIRVAYFSITTGTIVMNR